ncbi:hypothetical protein SAMN05192534_101313 [Alteribacillus persepolensis]|uniref:DUF2269 family protein n=1 Tax=Alteribacillus persepolensis TaxID=568899 RepID=A0A1G7YXJ9_9BACI|nr:hypothetical protein [Alteribacillus persepolensis]SDH01164.1 hypothetical protein SAMN05192534_101313 [Alteribacillus persepolensis]
MWFEIINFIIHWLTALSFFVLIPLPFFLKGMTGDNVYFIKKVYRPMIHIAHAGLIVSVITGLFLVQDWLSAWTFAVLILWLLIGAFLGLTAKSLRLSLEDETAKTPLLKHSTILTIAILIMFLLKFASWF